MERDRLRRLFQKKILSSLLSEFRNMVISIPNINEEEKLDQFVSRLKQYSRLEVFNSNPSNLESWNSLHVHSAIFASETYERNRGNV